VLVRRGQVYPSRSNHDIDLPLNLEQKAEGELDPYRDRTELEQIMDALYILGHSFDEEGGWSGIRTFLEAYLGSGTVTRAKPEKRDSTEDIYTGMFFHNYLASTRVASEPRDYVFSTMPQFPWYTYPADAKNMSFNAIFEDFYYQAAASGHGFTGRITRSMTDSTCTDSQNAWLPSQQQPEPTCLGDFLKLLGHRTSEEARLQGENIHQTSVVLVMEITDDILPKAMHIVEDTMRFFQRTWAECHTCGELSKYGSFPSDEWELDPFDWVRLGNGSPEVQQMLGLIEPNPPSGDLDLLKHVRKILDEMRCSLDFNLNQPQQQDWKSFVREMRGKWSSNLVRTMLLLAAMVSCRIGLSAAIWINHHFVPVLVNYPKTDDTTILGLLSKHAASQMLTPKDHIMISAGRHESRQGLGTDLVMVNPKTGLAVGIIPDFMSIAMPQDERLKRIKTLYGGDVKFVDSEGANVEFGPPLNPGH
jgi:hypothetical protein